MNKSIQAGIEKCGCFKPGVVSVYMLREILTAMLTEEKEPVDFDYIHNVEQQISQKLGALWDDIQTKNKTIEDRLAKIEDVYGKRLDAHFDRLASLESKKYATEDDVAKAIAESYIELRDRIARLEEQVRVLKDHSHFHKNQEGIPHPSLGRKKQFSQTGTR